MMHIADLEHHNKPDWFKCDECNSGADVLLDITTSGEDYLWICLDCLEKGTELLRDALKAKHANRGSRKS